MTFYDFPFLDPDPDEKRLIQIQNTDLLGNVKAGPGVENWWYRVVCPNLGHVALTEILGLHTLVNNIDMLRKKSPFESWNNFKTDGPFTLLPN